MTFDVESSPKKITIYAFKDGSLVFSTSVNMNRKIFQGGGLPLLQVETLAEADAILSKYAREVQGEWYLNAALDGPFDSVDVFFDLVTQIRKDAGQ